MSNDLLVLSRMCEENARAAAARHREVARVGPFEALLDRYDPLVWLNYAVPVAPLDDLAAARVALGELAALFAARQRCLRFEFHAAPWPLLPALLEEAGLECQAAHPVMACSRGASFMVHFSGVTPAILTADSNKHDLVAFRTIQDRAFALSRDLPDEATIEHFCEQLANGNEIWALVWVDGVAAAAGALYPIDGVAELAGVATLPELRRRGAALALCASLVSHYFASGGRLVWLSAADAAARSLYARVGFCDIDTRLNYIAAQHK